MAAMVPQGQQDRAPLQPPAPQQGGHEHHGGGPDEEAGQPQGGEVVAEQADGGDGDEHLQGRVVGVGDGGVGGGLAGFQVTGL